MISDAGARLEALDPERSFIVQAPAGSGKTELLTQRFLRLLAAVDFPEQILAITFTRKAVAEMRSRILRALESASGEMPASAHKRTTWELARAVLETDARRGWNLTQHPARLRIQTIDALNALLTRRLPILSSAGAALEPTEDPRPLYEAACRQLIERLGDETHEMHGLEALIAHLGNRVEKLIDLLSDMLARRDQWLHQVVSARSLEDLRSVLEATLRALIEHQLERLCRALGEPRRRELFELTQFAAHNLLTDGRADPRREAILKECVNCTAIPDERSRCMPVWRGIASMLFTQKGPLYRSVTKTQGFPPGGAEMKARMQRLLADLAEDEPLLDQLRAVLTLPDPEYSTEQWRIVEALLEVLPQAVGELQLVFQQEGKGDYVEAALRALDALGASGEPTDLALALDYRLHHILVDEFQDTSFTQLDLLERLTDGWSQGDGRTLFCVGDPMQSIYRFRQAEVGLFLQLQSRGLRNVSLTPLTLSANFRSTQPVVEWINRVFPAVFAPENDAEQGAVRYSASEAALPEAAGAVHVHAASSDDDLLEARNILAVIRSALERDSDARIAVLVTARAHVATLARELNSAGVPYQAVDIELLRERPVVQDLMALTRALVHLADRTAWLAVLRAPWCGLSLADLHALAAEDRNSTIRALLERLFISQSEPVLAPSSNSLAARTRRKPRANERQLALEWIDASPDSQLSREGRRRAEQTFTALENAQAERGRFVLREWVERTWNALGGPATLTDPQDLDDAEAFFCRLEQIESTSDLDDIAALEDRLDRLFARPRADASARVELMTIHRAKGLEFETVILPALHRGTRGEQRELLRWARIAGPSGGIVLAPVKADGADPDPIYNWIELLEKERARHERARLLYVAATRAKRDLHLFGAASVDVKDGVPEVRTPRSGTMLGMLWAELRSFFETDAAMQTDSESDAAAALTADPIRRLPEDWCAPAADPALASERPLQSVDLQRPQFDWVNEISRHVGTLVHRELERMTLAGVVQTDAAAEQASLPRLMAELAELGVPPDRCATAIERVRQAIDYTLNDARGRWLLGLDGDAREAESELSLSGMLDGELVEGVIDRTFLDAQGVRWIVDFKTSTHEGGGLSAFLDEEVLRYRRQLVRYVRLMRMFRPDQPVKAALYFPLMGEWREIGD